MLDAAPDMACRPGQEPACMLGIVAQPVGNPCQPCHSGSPQGKIHADRQIKPLTPQLLCHLPHAPKASMGALFIINQHPVNRRQHLRHRRRQGHRQHRQLRLWPLLPDCHSQGAGKYHIPDKSQIYNQYFLYIQLVNIRHNHNSVTHMQNSFIYLSDLSNLSA